MKRILHIVGGMQRAGAETLLMNLYRNLDRTKFQFDFVYFTNNKCDYDDEISDLGGQIFRIDSESRNKLKRIFVRYIQYYKLLKKLPQHQIIHSHINLNGTIFILIAQVLKKNRRISHSHISTGKQAIIPNLYRFICRGIIKKSANVYMACGIAAGEYLYPQIDKNDIIVLPNSINITSFQNQSNETDYLRKQLKLDSDIKLIVQIGRFTPQKNHEFTVNLIKHLVKNDAKLHFIFIGTGPLVENIQQSVKTENIEKFVTFFGVSDKIPKILHSADLFLMPSRLEGFPVVLVEAQACGIPCLISTNISPEVDMGLGLVSFMDLNDDLKNWEKEFHKMISAKSTDFQKITKIMKSKNFDAVDNVVQLQKIYSS